MKKLLLLVFMAVASVSYASAEWTTYYVTEEVGQEYSAFSTFKIDWENKFFFLDSDSEDETKGPIKKMQVNGNKKTFNIHYSKVLNEDFYCSAEFTTEDQEKGKFTLTLILDGQGGSKIRKTFLLSNKKPLKEIMRDPGSSIKDGIGKVSDLIKKKKEEKKDKKEKKE